MIFHIKEIRKVRKTQHHNSLFGHKGHEMRFLKDSEKSIISAYDEKQYKVMKN
jgi:hypothetical protein